jgi:prophage antirepressor-like protein
MRGNELTPFLFEGEHMTRVVMRDGSPWFVAVDVCRVLGIQNAAQAVAPLDEDERGISSTYTPSGHQEVIVISEGGLYTLILRSRDATKPGTVAHRFRKWVTAEVLPTIRRTGQYQAPIAEEDPEDLGSLPISTKIRLVDCMRHTFGEKASQQIAFKVRLPVVPAMEEAMRSQPDLFQGAALAMPGTVPGGMH